MARLITLDPSHGSRGTLNLRCGDALIVNALSARTGEDGPVRVLGPFVSGRVADDEIITRQGGEMTILLVAAAAGYAEVELRVGSPWGKTGSLTLRISVDA